MIDTQGDAGENVADDVAQGKADHRDHDGGDGDQAGSGLVEDLHQDGQAGSGEQSGADQVREQGGVGRAAAREERDPVQQQVADARGQPGQSQPHPDAEDMVQELRPGAVGGQMQPLCQQRGREKRPKPEAGEHRRRNQQSAGCPGHRRSFLILPSENGPGVRQVMAPARRIIPGRKHAPFTGMAANQD